MNTKKTQNQFLNLTQDLMFKIYFSKDKQVLLSLLKTFLPLPPGKTIKNISFLEIKEQKTHSKTESYRKQGENAPLTQTKQKITVMDSSLYPDIATNKQIVMDLRVQLNTGEKINVEIQSVFKKGFLNRVLFYWARLYTENLRKAEDYHHLCPAYSLIFTDFAVFAPKEDRYKTIDTSSIITSFSLRSDKEPHFMLNDQLKIVFVELSKFNTSLDNINLPDLFDFQKLWCYILKRSRSISKRECEILSKKGEEMKRAIEHLQNLSQDEEVRRWEEAREKFIRDQRAEKAYAFDEGLEKGIQQGKEEGRKQGKEEGRKQGKEEGMQKAKQELIKNMIKEGVSITTVSKITNWPEKKIQKLKNNLPGKK